MKKLFILELVLVGILFASCNNNLEEIQIPDQDGEQAIIGLDKGILSFENEAAFQEAVDKVRNNQISLTSLTRSADGSDFESLYAEFVQAMKEAESYYDRIEGYEEFKVKFPGLYYPEHGDDYSAYLPVSDEAIAKLTNREGKVIIAGEVRDMRDIFTYEKLVELNLTLNDGDFEVVYLDELPQTRKADFEGAIPIRVTPGVSYVMNKRKIKAVTGRNLGYKDQYSPLTGEVHLVFRKRGALNIWYNHWALTRIRIYAGIYNTLLHSGTKDGYSSHNHLFEVPYGFLTVDQVNHNLWRKWIITQVHFTYDAMDGYVFLVDLEHFMLQGWP